MVDGYWIAVDVIGIGLYYVKEVRFVALLYLIFLFLATRGFVSWFKISYGRDVELGLECG